MATAAAKDWVRRRDSLLETSLSDFADLEVEKYNFLLCGLVGSGKSSAVNLLLTALNNRDDSVSTKAVSERSTTHVTTDLRRFVRCLESDESILS